MKKKKSVPKIDPLVEGMFAKLLDRLVSLEKKTDAVLSRISQVKGPAGHEKQLYEAICADCAKVCEVPFRPSETRPVYCKECWAKRKGGSRPAPANGMPTLRPVSLPPKPKGNLNIPIQIPKAKAKPAKKSKKKK